LSPIQTISAGHVHGFVGDTEAMWIFGGEGTVLCGNGTKPYDPLTTSESDVKKILNAAAPLHFEELAGLWEEIMQGIKNARIGVVTTYAEIDQATSAPRKI